MKFCVEASKILEESKYTFSLRGKKKTEKKKQLFVLFFAKAWRKLIYGPP